MGIKFHVLMNIKLERLNEIFCPRILMLHSNLAVSPLSTPEYIPISAPILSSLQWMLGTIMPGLD